MISASGAGSPCLRKSIRAVNRCRRQSEGRQPEIYLWEKSVRGQVVLSGCRHGSFRSRKWAVTIEAAIQCR